MLMTGVRAPLFVAPGTSGDADLGELLKKGSLVLYFFPRAMTSGCTAEAVEFNHLLPEFKALGVGVVGVSVDSVARLQRFRDQNGIGFDFVSDRDRTIGSAYGTLMGDFTTSHERDTVLIGRDVAVMGAWHKVSAKGHAAAVLAEAKRLNDLGEL
jgi:peroxiredoxin Q/BCP